MPAIWREIIAFALIVLYIFVWYLVERRLRAITRRHVEKVGNDSHGIFYRVYLLQIASVRVIFVLWILAGTSIVLFLL